MGDKRGDDESIKEGCPRPPSLKGPAGSFISSPSPCLEGVLSLLVYTYQHINPEGVYLGDLFFFI